MAIFSRRQADETDQEMTRRLRQWLREAETGKLDNQTVIRLAAETEESFGRNYSRAEHRLINLAGLSTGEPDVAEIR